VLSYFLVRKVTRGTWLTGIDITKIDRNFPVPKEDNNDDNGEFIDAIKKVGPVAGGGPRCHFHGIDVPCFVQNSPHGGITPTILTNCLRRMDELKLFPRDDGIKPFLLLDSHDSRYDFHFLTYIRDPEHPWCCCIGLP
jgi:hypothetical protein